MWWQVMMGTQQRQKSRDAHRETCRRKTLESGPMCTRASSMGVCGLVCFRSWKTRRSRARASAAPQRRRSARSAGAWRLGTGDAGRRRMGSGC